MPTAIPAVAAFAASSAAAALVVNIATVIITNLVVGAITKALTKKPKSFEPPVNVTVRNSIENRRICMGIRRVGGSFAYVNTSSSGGNKADLLWYVIVFTGHEVDDLTDVYLDNEKVASGDINPSTGAVTGSTRFVGKLKIFKFKGTSGQTVNAALDAAFTEVTSNFRLRGCSGVILQMTRDDVAFFQGPPQSVTAICKGLKAYDPRKDSTNGGSGSHRVDNPSTWEWTPNPALLLRWYLTGGSVHNTGETTRLVRYGLQEPDSRIDEAYWIAAANICDEQLTGVLLPPDSVTTRYTCNAEFSTGQTHREIMQEILDSMGGTITYEHGEWRAFAAGYDSPSHSFTSEDLYGDLEVTDTTGLDERYNAVAAVFIDAGSGYTESTTIFRTDLDYETEDGGKRITREISVRAVTNQYQAQRLAEIELRKSRMMRVIKMRGALNMLKVAKNETFTLTHPRYGWVNKVFRCLERQFNLDASPAEVVITAREENSAVYADLLNGDYVTGTSATDEFKTELPDPPISLTTETQVHSVRVTVGLPASIPPGAIVQVFEHTASTPFSAAVLVAQGLENSFVVQRRDETTRFYWARIKTRSGALSDTFPASTGASGVAALAQTRDLAIDAATNLYMAEIDDATVNTPPTQASGNVLSFIVPAMSRAYTVEVSCTGVMQGNTTSGGARSTKVAIECAQATPTKVGSMGLNSAQESVATQGDMTVPAGTAATFRFTYDDTTGALNPLQILFTSTVFKVVAIKA